MLEDATVETIESDIMTKDLAICVHGWDVKEGEHYFTTDKFMDAIDKNFQKKWKDIMA